MSAGMVAWAAGSGGDWWLSRLDDRSTQVTLELIPAMDARTGQRDEGRQHHGGNDHVVDLPRQTTPMSRRITNDFSPAGVPGGNTCPRAAAIRLALAGVNPALACSTDWGKGGDGIGIPVRMSIRGRS
jgi:hypothetical protein